MDKKRCFKCLLLKDRSQFYAHRQMGDGLLGKCKECTKVDARLHFIAARERIREYDAQRAHDPERKRRSAEYIRRRRARSPEKARAYRLVAYAVRTGAIVRSPCEMCGSTDKVQAHHDDYSRPLDVQWLCFRCHRTHAHGQKYVAA